MLEIKTLPLSFCSEEAHNVVNPEAKEYIMNSLKNKHNINIDKKHAFILNNRSIYFLEKTQHIISIKSSGTNYYLYFTNINNINYCFFIDRKIKSGYTYPRIISVKYAFSDEVFNDTLLDGELVRDKDDNDSWIFLITDMLVCEGKKLETNIVGRFNKLYQVLKNKYNPNFNLDICPLVVKKLFLYKDYDYLITQFIPSLPYRTNGLYFNSLNTKHANHLFLYPKDSKTQFIKKPDKIETKNVAKELTFELKKTIHPEIYDLYYLNEDKQSMKYQNARISSLKTSKLVSKLFKENEIVYVLCKLNDKFNKWEPFKHSEKDKMCSKQDI